MATLCKELQMFPLIYSSLVIVDKAINYINNNYVHTLITYYNVDHKILLYKKRYSAATMDTSLIAADTGI